MKTKNLIVSFAFILLSIFSLNIFASENVAIKVPVANMYANPHENAAVVSQAIYGTNVKALETSGGWTSITSDDDYNGWVKSSDLGKNLKPANSPGVLQVKHLFAYIYRAPNTTTNQPLLMVPCGTLLTIVKVQDKRWIYVQLIDGGGGWIQSGDVTLHPKPLSMHEMLAFATDLVGLPYLWAGTSTYGFDCSGLVQFLYRQMGIILPRDAIAQTEWPNLIEVSKNRLQPGDALYFGHDGKITHEGMYLGKNKFIHSTAYQNPTVQISDIRGQYWTSIYMTARRLNSVKNLEEPAYKSSILPISASLQKRMLLYSWRPGCPVPIKDLVSLKVSYWGFDDRVHQGTLILHKTLAPEVSNIFKEIYEQRFPIEKIKPIEEYRGNDSNSMSDDNSSAFNCRAMSDFPNQYSIHSYGRAIDINPLINPYINNGVVDPPEGARYIDRSVFHKGKITSNSAICKIFTKYGWVWGGSWSDKLQDYQHFEKPLK